MSKWARVFAIVSVVILIALALLPVGVSTPHSLIMAQELRALASQGQIARFGPGQNVIELAKPVPAETN